MFGFGAISELPLSTLPVTGTGAHTGSATLSASASTTAYPQPLPGAATLSATGSTLSVGTRHICSASLLADTGTLSAVAYFTWTNSKTLSSSASISAYPQPLPGLATLNSPVTVAAAGQLNKQGATSLSSSATIAAHAQPLSAGITLSSTATISGSGALTKLGRATLSASGATLNVGVIHVGASSLLADVGTLSGNITGTIISSGGLSSSATVSSIPCLTIPVVSSISSSGSTSSIGFVEKLGQAHISTLGGFTSGFTQGFDRGSFVSGHPFIAQNHLFGITTLSANGTVERTASASLSASAKLEILQRLLCTASLTGNSVLLHGGSANLNAFALIEPILSSDYDNPDIIKIIAYIDRAREITGNIEKSKMITGYIDKQISVDSRIDLSNGITGYIDKIVEKTLVRER